MEFYQINDLERLSGIKAHTIRIWEKRYNLIEPQRSDTNIRFYSDEQVKRLLNVSTLLENGHKISKIAALKDNELRKLISKVLDEPMDSKVNNAFVNDLINAMLSFDEVAFEKIFSAVVTRLSIYNAMLEVFYPFLVKTGVLWSTEETSPAQEHFASHFIRKKLMAAIDGLPFPQQKDKKFLLFLPENEWHDVGLLFSDYIIRSHGYSTIYLGQNVPIKNIPLVIQKQKITHLLTFFIAGKDIDERVESVLQIIKRNKSAQLLVSGRVQQLDKYAKEKLVTILKSAEDLEKII
jgi:MerR family transcriptional regulator, light-induced transcriptional regulator